MHTFSLSEYMACIHRGDWHGVGEIMLRSAEKLASIGADFVICPDNTIHQALPFITTRSPLPWLHIADAVTQEALVRGFRCIGITGTQWLINSNVYPGVFSQHGLSYVLPTPEEQKQIHRIIMEELTMGEFSPHAVAVFQQTIERMKHAGCDAVLLGCTEIPLIMNDTNSPLPTLDSTRLLARAALARATASVV